VAADRVAILGLMLVICFAAVAQQGKGGAAKADLTGRYEGTAKNKAEDVITLTIDVTEKDGALSGTIDSSHGSFAISSGSHKGDDVTLEFDADGTAGTISLHKTEDKLVGTWSAGDDGGPVDLKKAAAQEGGAKGKS
jgi:hypothetical protein